MTTPTNKHRPEPEKASPAPPTKKAPAPSTDPSEELLAEIKRLNVNIERLNRKSRRITLSFFAGITRGLGAVIGATIVFGIFLAVLARFMRVPVVGGYVKQIVEYVQTAPKVPIPQETQEPTPEP